ncbi:hypothetical protein GQ53DRAFT_656706, partial [Thozetella sp. PMI_491]
YASNEFDEWEDTGFGEKWMITTSPRSKLSANIGPGGGVVISYQDTAGRLVGTMNVGDGWTAFGPLEAAPMVGTPQVLDVIDDKLHLFYIGEEGGLHYLIFDQEKGTWQGEPARATMAANCDSALTRMGSCSDNMIQNTKFETPIDNFMVTKNPETGSFESYFLTAGSMWAIEGDKEKTNLGKVEGDGKLIPSSKAQAGRYHHRSYHRHTSWGNAKYVEITRGRHGMTRIWY